MLAEIALKIDDLTARQTEVFFHSYRPKVGDYVIDLGAGSGTETVVLSQLVGESGTVVAVEANPATFELLLATIRRNNLRNCIPILAAINHESGPTLIGSNPAEDPDGISAAIAPQRDTTEYAVMSRVLGLTFPELISLLDSPSVDYVKVNIEGAERFITYMSGSELRISKHWCVSCHDFVDDPSCATWDSITRAFSSAGMRPFSRDELPDHDHARYYVYTSSDEIALKP